MSDIPGADTRPAMAAAETGHDGQAGLRPPHTQAGSAKGRWPRHDAGIHRGYLGIHCIYYPQWHGKLHGGVVAIAAIVHPASAGHTGRPFRTKGKAQIHFPGAGRAYGMVPGMQDGHFLRRHPSHMGGASAHAAVDCDLHQCIQHD